MALCRVALSFLAILAVSEQYSSGPPCGTLTPNHDGVKGDVPRAGQFALLFEPALKDGRAEVGTSYTIRLFEQVRGFALKTDNGQLQSLSSCSKTCDGDRYISHVTPGCSLILRWAPSRPGQATLAYTVVLAKHTFFPSMNRELQVVEPQSVVGPAPTQQNEQNQLIETEARRFNGLECRNYSGWDRYCASNIIGICRTFRRQCRRRCDPDCQ